MRKCVLAVLACFALALPLLCIVIIAWTPSATIAITDFKQYGAHSWRAALRNQYIPHIYRIFYRLPINFSEASKGGAAILENKISFQNLIGNIENVKPDKNCHFSIVNDNLLFTTTDSSNPSETGRSYEVQTILYARFYVYIVLYISIAVLFFLMTVTRPSFYALKIISVVKNCISFRMFTKFIKWQTVISNIRMQRKVALILASLSLFGLLPFMEIDYFFGGKFFNNEDGGIFCAGANSLGIASLWTYYNGYQHLYVRLFAYFANFFPFAYRPDILTAGYLLGYFFSMYIVSRIFLENSLSVLTTLVLVLLLALVPHDRSVTSPSITYVMWVGAIALTLYIANLHGAPPPLRLREAFVLLVVSLTGPFSGMLVPLIFAKMLLLKKSWCFLSRYLIVVICGMFQISSIFFTNRHSSATLLYWIQDYSKLFLTIPTFGWINETENILLLFSVIVFWISVLISIYSAIRASVLHEWWFRLALLIFVAAAINIAAYAHRRMLYPWNPNVNYQMERYVYVPCALLICAGIIIAHKNILHYTMLLSCISICVFTSLPLSNTWYRIDSFDRYRFNSFAAFSQQRPIIVPYESRTDGTSRAFWMGNKSELNERLLGYVPSIKVISNDVVDKMDYYDRRRNKSNRTDRKVLFFENPIDSMRGNHVGVQIDVSINWPEMGNIPWSFKLYWGWRNNFRDDDSLVQTHRLGNFRLFFAFPNDRDEYYLLLDPYMDSQKISIKKISIYDLP